MLVCFVLSLLYTWIRNGDEFDVFLIFHVFSLRLMFFFFPRHDDLIVMCNMNFLDYFNQLSELSKSSKYRNVLRHLIYIDILQVVLDALLRQFFEF